jgi:hypothetical protein
MTQRATRHARRPVSLFETIEPRVLMAAAPIDIEGVYNASLDQPRVYALVRESPTGDPLSASDPMSGVETFTFEAFYDTGASGMLLSKETADALGVTRATHNGEPVLFEDVGVGGSSFFGVSTPLYTSLAPYGADRDVDNIATFEQVYDQKFGPLRAQIAREEAGELLPPLDVFGMPTMQGKVVVMDARPLKSDDPMAFGLMKTYPYNPGTPYNPADDGNNPGIAPTNLHVDLSYAHFGRFTGVSPEGAAGPTMRYNPFIGPNPLLALDPTIPPDYTPGITVGRGSQTFTGSWLFDTGAAASILSLHGAEAVGVTYAPGTYHTDAPKLVDAQGNAVADQFSLQIGGVGGSFTAAGFFLDSMVLPTMEGQPIRYLRAPVLVADISVSDPHSGQDLTLDGVFGMNFLVSSMMVDGMSLGDVSAGAYDWIVFDEPNGVLGLNLPGRAAHSTVLGRRTFYNNSLLDGSNRAADAGDDNAIAYDKSGLLPGGTASFANYTGAPNGITGIMVDVSRLPEGASIGAEDFVFRAGTSANPSTWSIAPQPAVTVRRGAGAAGSDRVTFTWPDNQLKNRWLQVTVKANADTGLAEPDVFYYGNLAGETGDSSRAATVNGVDVARTRAASGRGADVDSRFDHNRDGRVNAVDSAVVRANLFQSLRLITAPAASAAAITAQSVSGAATVPDTRAAVPPRRRTLYDEQPDLLGRVP